MDFSYLTDDSHNSLTPFFMPRVLFNTYTIVCIIGGFSLLIWPRKSASFLITENIIPNHFFIISLIALAALSFINLYCGRGEFLKSEYFSSIGKDADLFETERNFITYGLVGFLIHTIFLFLPFLPILILSASISSVAFNDFILVISIIFLGSLFCRMFGFTTYLIWGWWKTIGYLVSIILGLFYLFISKLLYSELNPIWILYIIHNFD